MTGACPTPRNCTASSTTLARQTRPVACNRPGLQSHADQERGGQTRLRTILVEHVPHAACIPLRGPSTSRLAGHWDSCRHRDRRSSNGDTDGRPRRRRQRADAKSGDPSQFPQGRGPQGDVMRIYNLARCVRGGTAEPRTNGPNVEMKYVRQEPRAARLSRGVQTGHHVTVGVAQSGHCTAVVATVRHPAPTGFADSTATAMTRSRAGSSMARQSTSSSSIVTATAASPPTKPRPGPRLHATEDRHGPHDPNSRDGALYPPSEFDAM